MPPIAALTVGDAAIAAVGLLMAFFEGWLFMLRRRHAEHLWAAVLCATAGAYATCMVVHYNADQATALVATKAEALVMVLMAHAVLLFAAAFVGQKLPVPRWALVGSATVGSLLSVSPWLIPHVEPVSMVWLHEAFWRRPQTALLTVLQLEGAAITLLGVRVLLRHRARRPTDSSYILIGLLVWGATTLAMFVQSLLAWPLVLSLAEYGFLGFSISLVAKDAAHYMRLLGQTERDVAAARTLQRDMLDAVGEGVVLLNAELSVQLWNPVMAKLCGVAEREAMNRTLADLLRLASEQRDNLRRGVVDAQRTGRVELDDLDVSLPSGNRKLSCTLTPYSGRAGDAPRALAVVRDVTESRALTARMMQLDRMSVVGTLAAGVGHEINNPLAFITLNLEESRRHLRENLSSGTLSTETQRELRELTEESLTGARRIADIVSALRSLARSDGNQEVTTLSAALDTAIAMTASETKHRAKLVVEHDSALPNVIANPSRLGQVFVNLLVNAAQAIEEGGGRENEIRVRTFQRGDMAVAEVSDTGCGMTPEQAERIFDPFFTTKPVGQGTGLGLAICRETVTSLGGDIEVETEPGQGATFRVVLPITTRSIEDSRAPVSVRPDSWRPRLLIIDDEAAILRALERSLGKDFAIITAPDAHSALVELERDRAFDALITDLHMPQTTGMQLHALIAQRFPAFEPRVFFMSGGASTDEVRSFCERYSERIIQKPFEPRALRAQIKRLLDRLA